MRFACLSFVYSEDQFFRSEFSSKDIEKSELLCGKSFEELK